MTSVGYTTMSGWTVLNSNLISVIWVKGPARYLYPTVSDSVVSQTLFFSFTVWSDSEVSEYSGCCRAQ